jgi:trehalose 6-phosphate synthase
MHFFRLRLVAALLAGISIISVASTYFDVLAHKHTMGAELARRTQWLGAELQKQLELQLDMGERIDWSEALTSLRHQPDQPSLAVYDDAGLLVGYAGTKPPTNKGSSTLVDHVLNSGTEANRFARISERSGEAAAPSAYQGVIQTVFAPRSRLLFEDALPLHYGERTTCVLVLIADADYIRIESNRVWRRSFLGIAVMVVLIVVVTLLMVRWFLQQPVTRAADWLRRLRRGEAEVAEGAGEFGDLVPLAHEVTLLAEHLTRAREEAANEARLRDHAEHIWTAHRLAVHVRDRLGSGRLFIVSNREPYMHVRNGARSECVVPPSGVVTAIEPILRACDGTWIAHGSGNDDRAFVDEHDRLRVPPDEARYTLRRVWITPEEEAGYYDGFSNEGLWPLCHIAHTRPLFRAGDWNSYQSVNARFAEVLLEEMEGVDHPVVFVQDYHFALLPRMIKDARPEARVGIFWHIPWPNAEAFGICPWQSDLLDGLLGADVIGFHLQSHCNNFMDTVDRVLEARTDWEHFTIQRNSHISAVRPYPISVAWDDSKNGASKAGGHAMNAINRSVSLKQVEGDLQHAFAGRATREEVGPELNMGIERLLLGVDRMDYTKGIVERLLAVEHLLEEYPGYLERIAVVQIASPSRTRIPSYAALRSQVEYTVERINRRFATTRWKPILLIQKQLSHEEIARYYRAADICMVTSLHDGMNLVAKEFVAIRDDCKGVLVLSRFTGSAHELDDALLVNPYDIVQVSEAIRTGLEMSREEQQQRMERMRLHVKEHNVYRWASSVLTDLCAVRIEDSPLPVAPIHPPQALSGQLLAMRPRTEAMSEPAIRKTGERAGTRY